MQKDKEGKLLQMGLICDLTLNFRVQSSSEHGSRESELFAASKAVLTSDKLSEIRNKNIC